MFIKIRSRSRCCNCAKFNCVWAIIRLIALRCWEWREYKNVISVKTLVVMLHLWSLSHNLDPNETVINFVFYFKPTELIKQPKSWQKVYGITRRNPNCKTLIPKLVMVTLRAHCEPLNSNWSKNCECVVEFLFFSCRRLCTVNFGIRTHPLTP